MRVHQIFTDSPLRNFSYLIEGEGEVFCIDPHYPQQILDALKKIGKNLTAIINTHEHLDHHCGNKEVAAATECAVYAHEKAKGKIPRVDRFLKDNEVIPLGNEDQLIVLDTPGHTFAHVSLLARSSNEVSSVFTGDTLFNAGVGNCYNGGDVETLYQTVARHFQSMDDGVLLYPGHEYMENNLQFTLQCEPDNKKAHELLLQYKRRKNGFIVNDMGIEKEINVFLRADKESFIDLRKKRDNW